MRAPRQDPPVVQIRPLVDISAPCSSFTPELPNCAKQKTTKDKGKGENQTPNDKSEVQFPFRCTNNRENNPNALCESISHVSLLPSGSIHAITALGQIFRCALFPSVGTVALILADATPSRTCPLPFQLGASHADTIYTHHGAFRSDSSGKPFHFVFRCGPQRD